MNPETVQAIIGQRPDDGTAEQMALAKALSNTNTLGQVGQLTGDRVIAPVGIDLSNQTMVNAQGLQKARQLELQRKMVQDQYGEANKIARERNALTAGLVRQRKADSMDWKKEQQLNRDIQLFGTRLSKEGVPQLGSALDGVDAALADYRKPDGTLSDDVPGIGFLENIPVVGSLFGGEEGRNVRGALQGAVNYVIKDTSGAAVSDQEYVRLQQQLRQTPLDSPQNIDKAIDLVKQAYDRKVSIIMGGRGVNAQEVLSHFQQSGGQFRGMDQYLPEEDLSDVSGYGDPAYDPGVDPELTPDEMSEYNTLMEQYNAN